MNSPCPQDPELYWLHAVAPDAALALHIERCADCRARVERAKAGLRLLGELAQQKAPRELDGLVVAAFHAGARQERVARHVQALDRQLAPEELGQRAEEAGAWAGDACAPEELDERVEIELRDPALSMSRRFLRKLDRVQAPEALDARIASRGRRSRIRPLVMIGGLLVLVGLGSLALQQWSAGQTEAVQPRVAVQWQEEYIESADQLDPVARALIGGLSGGASEVLGREKL